MANTLAYYSTAIKFYIMKNFRGKSLFYFDSVKREDG
jgi:hypothetical protein